MASDLQVNGTLPRPDHHRETGLYYPLQRWSTFLLAHVILLQPSHPIKTVVTKTRDKDGPVSLSRESSRWSPWTKATV